MDNEQKPQNLKDIMRSEYIRCSQDPIHFMRKYCFISHPQRGKILFHLYPFQEKVLKLFGKHNHLVINKSRQLGISTLVAGYSLWLMIFHSDKNVVCVATKQETAKNMVTKVQVMYDNLPTWLKGKKKPIEANKLSLKLANGSGIKAVAASADAGRSEAVSLLIMDECISGENTINIRDKRIINKVNISLEELYLNNIKNLKDYEINTPHGWCSFEGIKEEIIPYYFKISFEDGTELKGSEGHQVKMEHGEWIELGIIQIGDIIYNNKIVTNVECIGEELKVYDIISVENEDSSYIASDIIQHNCAFIEDIDRIYTSIKPTIATGGSIIALSSPNGIGNWFHRTFTKAQEKDSDSDFIPILLPWDVHPERNPEWYRKECASMSKKEIAQEYECDFLSSGNTVIDPEIIKEYESFIEEPIERRGIGGSYWIFKYVDFDRKYAIVADVARGDGSDYSTFHVIDVLDCEQVAEFKLQISTKQFAHLLVAAAIEWNNAELIVENNNMGWDVVTTIEELNYPNLYYSPKSNNDMSPDKFIAKMESNNVVPGFSNNTFTRPLMISKFEACLREKTFIYHSIRLHGEVKTFIWYKSKAQAQSGYNDDLIIPACIFVYVRDTSLKYMSYSNEMTRNTLGGMKKAESQVTPAMYNRNQQFQNPYQMNIGYHNQVEDISWLLK